MGPYGHYPPNMSHTVASPNQPVSNGQMPMQQHMHPVYPNPPMGYQQPNMIHPALQQQYQQRPMYQQPGMYQQPNSGYNMQMNNQPMVARPIYQQQGYGFNGNMPFGTGNDGSDSRYADMNIQSPVQPQVQPSQQPIQLTAAIEEEPLTPLEGSEFVPLAEDGISVEVETKGGYFRYITKGASTMSANIDLSNIKIDTLAKGKFKASQDIVNTNVGWWMVSGSPDIDYLNMFKFVAAEEGLDAVCSASRSSIPVLIEHDMADKCTVASIVNHTKDLSKVAAALRNKVESTTLTDRGKEYFLTLDAIITSMINNSICAGANISEVSIESFMTDYDDLVNWITANVKEDTHNKAAIKALYTVYTGIQNMAKYEEEANDIKHLVSGDKVRERVIPYFSNIIYIANKDYQKAIDDAYAQSSDIGTNTLSVTEKSAPVTYGLLNAVVWEDSEDLLLVTDKAVYGVYKSPFGYSTIKARYV